MTDSIRKCIECGFPLVHEPAYKLKCDVCTGEMARRVKEILKKKYDDAIAELEFAQEWGESASIVVRMPGKLVSIDKEKLRVYVDIYGVGVREFGVTDVEVHIPAPG